MDRDQLKQWLDEGLSLPQIGELAGRHPSTVGYWVRKHGLVANGKAKYAPRGGLTREQLEPLVEAGLTDAQIAVKLDRGISTIRHWRKRLGLCRPGPERLGRQEIDEAVRSGHRTVVRDCPRHGRTEFALVGADFQPRCKRCRADAVQRRRRKVKRILVEEAGGRCMLCGYDRCIAALEFHHREPSQKSFGLSRRGITRAIDKVRAEAAKCVLLCSNCHAEVEAGVATLP